MRPTPKPITPAPVSPLAWPPWFRGTGYHRWRQMKKDQPGVPTRRKGEA